MELGVAKYKLQWEKLDLLIESFAEHIDLSIESKYFFICKDKMKIRWGFDIRSLHRLMQHNFVNPYTRESFTDEIKNTIELRIKQLQKTGNEIDHIDTLERNKEEI